MKKHILAIGLATSLLTTSLSAKEVDIEDKISSLYISFFKRAADMAGLAYWKNAATVSSNPSDILRLLAKGFAEHPKFQEMYASMGEDAFVRAIYSNSLGESGDEEGVAYWTDKVIKDTSINSRSNMVADFMDISLTADLTTANYPTLTSAELESARLRQKLIRNMVEVSIYYSKKLGVRTNIAQEKDSLNRSVRSIENDPAYLASIKVLSEITVEDASVEQAKAKIYGLVADSNAINAINNRWDTLPEVIEIDYSVPTTNDDDQHHPI